MKMFEVKLASSDSPAEMKGMLAAYVCQRVAEIVKVLCYGETLSVAADIEAAVHQNIWKGIVK